MKLKEFLCEAVSTKAGILPYFIEDDGSLSYLFMTSSDANYGGADPMIAKGHVDKGETPEIAAIREGQEELGLKKTNIVSGTVEECWVDTIGGMTANYQMSIFACEVKDKDDFDHPHYETKETNWFSYEEAQHKVRKSHLSILKHINDKLNSQNITESINDKGIFKAVFVMGIPGSGKSYTVDKIAGSIMPRIVNTDSSLEFLVKKYGDDYKNVWERHGPKTEKMTQGKLKRALDGALPLMLENTSASASSILLRMGLLESLGYDIAMVYINTDLEVALDRANKRDRVVDADFIKRAHVKIEKDVEFLKPKFLKFMEIKNSAGELTDDVLMQAYKAMQHFYSSPVQNPIGKRNMESMKAGNGYMVDSVLEEDELSSMVSSWYTT